MSSPLLPSAHLSFAIVLVLPIKLQPNCIKYPGRQIAFNLLAPNIAQIRLLRKHRNAPHGRTLCCVYKTSAKLLLFLNTTPWILDWTPNGQISFCTMASKIENISSKYLCHCNCGERALYLLSDSLDFSGCLLLGSATVTGDPWSWVKVA